MPPSSVDRRRPRRPGTRPCRGRTSAPARSRCTPAPGAPSGLPTARLASRSDTSSIGPLGGTPTCQYPRRPGQSCTVVSAPGSSTSIRGSGSVTSSSVDGRVHGGPDVGSASAARSSPRLVTTPSTRVSPERRAEAVERLLAVAAGRDDLREHRVVARRDLKPRLDPRVDPQDVRRAARPARPR